MDEFYLSEEIVEWIGLKKSEYLSRLIENMEPDDFQFEDYHHFDGQIPATISTPDWSTETLEDGKTLKTFGRAYQDRETFHQVVIGAVIEDQGKNDVFVPIITFITKKDNLLKLFSAGNITRPLMN